MPSQSILLPGGRTLEILYGDLLDQPVDAIVNAANAYLEHGGGVAGAISRRGGPAVQAESTAWVHRHGLVTNRRPAVTGAGDLPFRFIIHAVGPMWGEGDEDEKLYQAVIGSLEAAAYLQLSSLAMPAISTGIFGFPHERAARIILSTIRQYFDQAVSTSLQRVVIVLRDESLYNIFAAILSDPG